jgi:hypothetical protein
MSSRTPPHANNALTTSTHTHTRTHRRISATCPEAGGHRIDPRPILCSIHTARKAAHARAAVQQQTRIRERRRTKQIWISGANRSTGLQEPAQRRTSSLLAHTLSPDAIISTVGACSAPPRPGLVVRSCASERTQQWVNYAGSHHHLTAVVVNDGERTQTTNENKDRKKRREEERERERERVAAGARTMHQYRRSNHGDAS